MTAKRQRAPTDQTRFLVIWWMSKTPYAAVFENRVAAEAAANVRNALLVTIKGERTKVEEVVDWYRRDEEGKPMPAEWRELLGHHHVPWHGRPIVRAAVEENDVSPPIQTAAEA